MLNLLHDLGYEIWEKDLLSQVKIYGNSENSVILVCEADGSLSGLVAGHLIPLVHQNGYLGRITALAVETDARGRGIDAALVDALEAWFKEHGCLRFEVTSGPSCSPPKSKDEGDARTYTWRASHRQVT